MHYTGLLCKVFLGFRCQPRRPAQEDYGAPTRRSKTHEHSM